MGLLAVFAESERFFTATQSQMLDGLLGEGVAGERALQAWAAAVDIDAIDDASYRLIPALYARAGSDPALHAHHGRLKGIYRYCFYRNNRFLARMEGVFSALAAAQIDFILFKGVSIVVQYHSSAAVRSCGDCDILVHPRDKERAEAVLAGCGFVYRYDAEHRHRDRHSHDFVDRFENGFDLHWFALPECREAGTDDGFWRRSHRIAWKDHSLRVLAPEDEVLVAGMNGIRELENARADWLYDAWTLFRATPGFDWRRLHGELARRRLGERFLAALGQLFRFLPGFPAAAVEKVFAAEMKAAARQLVAENRTFALDRRTDRRLAAAMAPPWGRRRLLGAIRGTDWRADIARSRDVVRYMCYAAHEDGSVSRLYLHRDAEAHLGEIFDIADPQALRAADNLARRRDELGFSLPAGTLRIPQDHRPRRYDATVTAERPLLRFAAPDTATLTVGVRVTNDSTWPWHLFAGSRYEFGLSYHLFNETGECLRWDFPRVYFLVARIGQVAMLLPGDSLQLELEIERPPEPGRYEVRLDLVHELIAWFDPDGRSFPRLLVDVP